MLWNKILIRARRSLFPGEATKKNPLGPSGAIKCFQWFIGSLWKSCACKWIEEYEKWDIGVTKWDVAHA